MELYGVESMRFAAVIVNILLIALALGMRFALHFSLNINTLRDLVARFTWLILLSFLATLVIGIMIFRWKQLCIATITTALIGAALYVAWFSVFMPF